MQWMVNCPDSFVYNQNQSRCLSFGIDTTSGGAARGGSGSKQAEKDAIFIASAVRDCLIGSGAGDKNDKVNIYTLSGDRDKCTAAGFKQAFKEEFEQVGEGGLLIFTFSGSATVLPGGSCTLCPVDYDPSNEATHIAADTMLKWIADLSSGSRLQKHVLFAFNCPLANRLVEGTTDMKKHGSSMGKVSIYSLGVTSGVENSLGLILCVLEHSFFAYFFDHFMRNASKSQAGNFMLKQSFMQVCQCCEALSSLVVTYRDGELKSNIMEALAAYIKHDGRAETDSSNQVGRFEFLTKHLDLKKGSRVILHTKVDAFLECVREFNGPLWILKNNGVLANEGVLETCFCVMVLSLASFQVAQDKESIQEPVVFFQVFMRVASTLEPVYLGSQEASPEIEYKNMFRKCEKFYMQVLKENNVKDKKVHDYLCEVYAEINS